MYNGQQKEELTIWALTNKIDNRYNELCVMTTTATATAYSNNPALNAEKHREKKKTNNMWTAPHCINMLLFWDFFSRWDCCHKLHFYDMFDIEFGRCACSVCVNTCSKAGHKLFKGLNHKCTHTHTHSPSLAPLFCSTTGIVSLHQNRFCVWPIIVSLLLRSFFGCWLACSFACSHSMWQLKYMYLCASQQLRFSIQCVLSLNLSSWLFLFCICRSFICIFEI